MNALINFVIVRVSIVIFCLILGFFAWESTIYAEDFVRSDCNGDGQVDLADAAYIHHFSTTGELGTPECLSALDVDDNGDPNVTDLVFLTNYLFGGGPAPSGPFPTCGSESNG